MNTTEIPETILMIGALLLGAFAFGAFALWLAGLDRRSKR